jgi:hypothetical protein
VLRVLEPALRIKYFICREFTCRKEKRKTAHWGMQGDLETGDPSESGWGVGFIAFFCIA